MAGTMEEAPADVTPAPDAPPRAWRVPLAAVLVALGLAVAPILVSCVHAAGHYVLEGNNAEEAITAQDVLTGHLPLRGVHSSATAWADIGDVYHPGPMLFFVLAPLAALFRFRPEGFLFAAAVIDVAAVVGVAVFALRRRGRLFAVATLAAAAALIWGLGEEVPHDIWNPHIAILPFFLLLFLVWSVLEGDTAAYVPAVVVGTFVVQDHYGYLPVVAVMAGLVAVVLVVRRRWSWQLPIALATGLVLWSPAVYDELTRTPGNPSQLVRFVTSDPENGRMGVAFAFERLVEFLGWRPLWTNRNPVGYSIFLDPTASQYVVGGLVALVAVGTLAAAFLTRRRADVAPLGVAVVVVAAIFISTASLPSETSSQGLYNYRAWWPATIFLLLATGLTVVRLVAPEVRVRGAGVARAATAGFVGVALLFSAVACWTPRTDQDRSRWAWPAIAALTEEIPPQLDGEGPYLVVGRGIMAYASVAASVIQALEREGISTMVSREQESTLGRFRRWDPDRSRGTVFLIGNGAKPPAGSELLARWEATPGQRAADEDNPYFSPEVEAWLVPPRVVLPEVNFRGLSRPRTAR